LETFLSNIKQINTLEGAVDILKQSFTFTHKIEEAVEFSIEAHKGQYRKSGEEYVIHPILVAAITAYNSNDESMIIAALLHDVVEDTKYSLHDIETRFGNDVAHIVDGLTKITEIRDTELIRSSSNEKLLQSALTFRKMLIASIDDVRVLIVKLYDRTHNMLTLEALKPEKQIRISEETLVVYAQIAHRLGMSAIKNVLEDLSFFYIYPQDYKQIDNYITTYQEKIQATFDKFLDDIKEVLGVYDGSEIEIFSRIKHYYSIYMKMQRKGVNIDEVLDLFAIRIIVKEPLDCYKVLGKIHTTYKPLIARFKDYVAIPKENGYQTIHTTVFHNSKIFEVQIRTQEMHHIAEYGVAAHWKYKSGDTSNTKGPNLKWLHTLEIDNSNIEEFYDDTKKELFNEEIIVYSPKGDIFTMPRGSTAYDFAYMIHTDLGNKALDCYINTIKKPLLTELKSGDIITIEKGEQLITRCSWYNIVKTTKAKKSIKHLCQNRQKQIDVLNGTNIVNTIFSKHQKKILDTYSQPRIEKTVYNLDHLKNIKKMIEKKYKNEKGILSRLTSRSIKLKEYKFENMIFYSNFVISSVSMDHCCHPKLNDDIVAFKEGKEVIVHHKMCDHAYSLMNEGKEMIYCKWSDDKHYTYKMVVSLQNKRGELARLLTHLSKYEATILFIEYGKDKHSHTQYCTIDFEVQSNDIERLKKIVNQKAKVIEFYSSHDAFKEV
jgi:GTP pyrophosphokinase